MDDDALVETVREGLDDIRAALDDKVDDIARAVATGLGDVGLRISESLPQHGRGWDWGMVIHDAIGIPLSDGLFNGLSGGMVILPAGSKLVTEDRRGTTVTPVVAMRDSESVWVCTDVGR